MKIGRIGYADIEAADKPAGHIAHVAADDPSAVRKAAQLKVLAGQLGRAGGYLQTACRASRIAQQRHYSKNTDAAAEIKDALFASYLCESAEEHRVLRQLEIFVVLPETVSGK